MTEDAEIPGSTRLPGVGLRLDLTDLDGGLLQVVRRHDGVVELHSSDDNATLLDENTAHTLAAFMTGRYVMPPELATRIRDTLGCLRFDWVRLPKHAFAVGKTIEGLQVRSRTGATIVAILRGSIPIVSPEPTVTLATGDELVYASPDQSVEAFERYVLEGK